MQQFQQQSQQHEASSSLLAARLALVSGFAPSSLQSCAAALLRLADLVAPAPFAFGAAPGLADIAYPCTLQMARMMAEALGLPEPLTKGSAVASDAFFPFADSLLEAAAAGATCVIQPGGSMRDDEVIAAADEAGIAMVFTGMRHFRH